MHSRVSLFLLCTLGLGCSDAPNGPAPVGTPFFHATIDGAPWQPSVTLARCESEKLTLEADRHFGSPDTIEVFFVQLWNLTHLSAYSLGDSTSLQYAIFSSIPETGGANTIWYHTGNGIPGQVSITGVNVTDSLVAGTFRFTVVADADSSVTRLFAGSFRMPIAPASTPSQPACTVPSN